MMGVLKNWRGVEQEVQEVVFDLSLRQIAGMDGPCVMSSPLRNADVVELDSWRFKTAADE